MNKRVASLCLFLCCIQSASAKNETDTVKAFVAAFNQHDINAMLDVATPNMKWMSISGSAVSVETNNHDELASAMTSYFKSMPSARSQLREMTQSGHFVYALEEAFWSAGGEEKSQCSMAIYEFKQEKISQVWYFPSHQCD